MSTMPDCCAICAGRDLERVIPLPDYPLTDTLCEAVPDTPLPVYDQSLMQCADCGHLQLETFLPPAVLYGDAYRFRTGESALGRAGTAFFLDFLERIAPGRQFRTAVDVGCNDLHGLAMLEGRARNRIGIDPIWANRSAPDGSGITVIGSTIEETNWAFLGEAKTDLIMCRHTLEHLTDPRAIVDQFMAHLSDDGLLIIEVPGVEPMVANFRFDQIFHQHLHYFSRPALHRLVAASGGDVVGEDENSGNWGARLTAIRRGPAHGARTPPGTAPSRDDIDRRYAVFRRHMRTAGEVLEIACEDIGFVGYGAAQMLPVLAWHLDCDLDCLDCVLDDDATKDGLRYANLPLAVRHPEDCSAWQDGGVLVTAVDHAGSILRRLRDAPPKQLIHPLCFV